jgi:hypothetical protein
MKYDYDMKIKKTLTSGIIMIAAWLFAILISNMIYGLFWDTPDRVLVFILTWQFILSIILAVILREFIHAVLFAVYNPKGWSSVRMEANIGKDDLLCSCKEPIKAKHYRTVLIMPLILTGIIPYLISFIWGIYPLMYLSVLIIFGCYRDVVALYRKRNLPSDTYV